MAKYTEAFLTTTGKPITIMQVRNEYNFDHAVYEKNYKGHLFCPFCKVVPLSVVHVNGFLYFRGHPHEEHGSNCMYGLKEIVIKDVQKISGDIEKQALSQIDILLRSTYDRNQNTDSTRAESHSPNGSNVPVVHQQQTIQKRLLQCRIEILPELLVANEAPREIRVYYGEAFCEVVNAKNPYSEVDIKVLVIKDIVAKKTIMGLTMSLAVWEHFSAEVKTLLQVAQQPTHIAFLGGPSSLQIQELKLPYTCYLRKSTYLKISED